jgi:hypothetical protein
VAKAFVSYVRENFQEVQRIVFLLREFEVDVWHDRDSLTPGLRWADEIRHGIANGEFFLACFSKAYAERGKTYMNEELILAVEHLRQIPTNRTWFLPIRLDDCEIPERSIGAGETLGSIQRIDLDSDWTAGMEMLLSVLAPGTQTVPRLIAQMDDESARRRVEAIEALGRLGRLGRKAVPRMVERIPIEASLSLGLTPLAAIRDSLPKLGFEDAELFNAIDEEFERRKTPKAAAFG